MTDREAIDFASRLARLRDVEVAAEMVAKLEQAEAEQAEAEPEASDAERLAAATAELEAAKARIAELETNLAAKPNATTQPGQPLVETLWTFPTAEDFKTKGGRGYAGNDGKAFKINHDGMTYNIKVTRWKVDKYDKKS